MELSKLGRVGDLDDLELLHAKDLQPAGVKPCVSWRALTRNVSVGGDKERARARACGRGANVRALAGAAEGRVRDGCDGRRHSSKAREDRCQAKSSEGENAKERARGPGRVQREGAKAERDREGKGEGEGEGRRGTGREDERTRESGPQGDLGGVRGSARLGGNRKNGRAFHGIHQPPRSPSLGRTPSLLSSPLPPSRRSAPLFLLCDSALHLLCVSVPCPPSAAPCPALSPPPRPALPLRPALSWPPCPHGAGLQRQRRRARAAARARHAAGRRRRALRRTLRRWTKVGAARSRKRPCLLAACADEGRPPSPSRSLNAPSPSRSLNAPSPSRLPNAPSPVTLVDCLLPAACRTAPAFSDPSCLVTRAARSQVRGRLLALCGRRHAQGHLRG